MNLTISEIIQILDNELKWCLEHDDPALTNDYKYGFQKGLIQAEYVVIKAEQVLENANNDQSGTKSNKGQKRNRHNATRTTRPRAGMDTHNSKAG